MHHPLSLAEVKCDWFLAPDRLAGVHSLFDELSVRISRSDDDYRIDRGMLDRLQTVSQRQLGAGYYPATLGPFCH